MAEKESLRRQIELLQGIINKHKTVHGNVPAPLSSAARTWRNPVQSTNSAPHLWHTGPSQSNFPHQPHQLQKPVQQKLQPQKPQHLQEQHRQQLQQLQHLQQKLDQQKLLQEKLQQQKHQQQNQPQVEKQQQHPPQQQQQPQHPEPLEQHPAHGWRKKYSLVNKPQPAAQPSGLANVPVTSTKVFTNQALQLTLSKQPDALPTAKGRGQSVWVSSSYSKTAATRRAPPAVNPGMPSLGTVLDKTQITCSEEPCKFFKKSDHDSQQQSLMEVRDHRKQGRLKEPGEVSTPCTTLTKGTKIRNSATKWTSELCRTRSESALVLSGKPQKSPTLRSQVQRGPTTVKKLTSPVVSPTNSDTASIGGNFTKVRQNPSTVVCTSPSQVSPDACVNPLKRRLVTTHTIYSPQKCATPTTPAQVLKCRKTKYTWVANPLRVSRASRKSVSPKMVESIRKSPVGTIKTILPKVSPKGDMSVKSKKAPVLLKGGASSSKYKWKAPTSVACSTPLKSKFKWHAAAQGQHSGPQLLASKPVVPQSLAKPAANFGVSKSPFSDSPHPGYKVKSRTKIIRRKSFTSSPTDKKSSPLAQDTVKSHYFLRRRTPPKIQTVKKISPKGLVQISKHKLRRLPAPKTLAVSRDGPSPAGFRSSPAPRVIKTRYKIVKQSAACGGGGSPAAAAASISPTLLWKARKLSAARWLLLHRMRQISPTGKPSPLQQQKWKSRGLRCIGGVMYRVSANKLSKHTSPPIRTSDVSSKYFTRSGRLFSSPNSPTYISPNGTSRSPTPSRYIASRAVQRSLAIIRQAKQKKKKEYCMYYNRFGKCNRGENCPYIHGPEKVAVCTRFLRGTCKKTDGTCTFSHKVSKDKMPVCSFYLRGICSNSNCPYSHVYVSKKAEVCLEFLKGYCPLGEKCKKKHTLVCPDFAKNGSCPKGAKCKLQHRQHKRNKRPLGSIEQQDQDRRTVKQGRHEEASRNVSRFSEERSVGVKASTAMSPNDAEQPGTSGLQKLPSFISLKSLSPTSPTEVRPPLRERSGDESGKPLQIKPRL